MEAAFARQILDWLRTHKPAPLLEQVQFREIAEGHCVQMRHVGSHDDEPTSFRQMEAFAEAKGLRRLSKVHREIYLKDPRKTAPDTQQTVLRFQVKKI